MNKLLLLLKTYGKVYLGSISKKSNKKEYFSGGALVIAISLLFIVLFSSTAVTTISQFLQLDPPEPIFALYVLTSTGLVFMLLTVVLRGTNFKKSNDHELLLSLPFTRTEIVLSKILKDYLFDFLSLLLIMMPGYVCYYVMVKDTSISVIINGVIVIILLTFFANAIAIFLSTFISKLTRKLKHKDVIRTLISVIITILFIVFYYVTNMSMTSSVDFIDKYLNFYPLKWIVEFIALNDIVSLLCLICGCVIPFVIAVLITVYNFNHPESGFVSSKKTLTYKKSSVTKNLFKNEVGRYFRSTIYVINTIIGALFVLLFGFLISGFGLDRITSMIETLMPNPESYIKHLNVIIILMFMLVASMTITTSAAISIEGKHFWILKAHPIKEKHIFNAKLLLNLIIGGIPIIISSIVLSFVIGFEYFPFLLLLPLLSLSFSALFGLINNLKYYKLDWKDEQEIIKQGMSVLVSLGTGILPILVIVVIYLLCNSFINPFIFLGIVLIIMMFLNYLLYHYLLTKGVKRFRNIIE